MAYTIYADAARKRGASVAEYRAAVALDAALEILREAAVNVVHDTPLESPAWNTLVNAARHITATEAL